MQGPSQVAGRRGRTHAPAAATAGAPAMESLEPRLLLDAAVDQDPYVVGLGASDAVVAGPAPDDLDALLGLVGGARGDAVAMAFTSGDLTVTSALSQQYGYYKTTSATTSLSGTSNPATTQSVLVSGAAATWNPVSGAWSKADVALNPGITKVLVQAFSGAGGGGSEVERTYIDIWYDDGSVQSVSGALPTGTTTWTAAGGPYRVTASVTVPSGATLVIEPGATVYFDGSQGLTVQTGGRLLADGTETQRIRFTRRPDSTSTWSGLTFSSTTADNRVTFADIAYGKVSVTSSVVLIDHAVWSNLNGQLLNTSHPRLTVSNSVFPNTTGTEPLYISGLSGSDYMIFEGNVVGTTTGYSDVIEFGQSKRPGPVPQIRNNIFLGGNDDALDLDGVDVHVEGNLFMNFHKNHPRDSTANAIATGSPHSQVVAIGNVFYDCDYAIMLKEGGYLTAYNNVFAGCDIAAIHFDEVEQFGSKLDPAGAPANGGYLDGNIFVDNFRDLMYVYTDARTLVTRDSTARYLVPTGDIGTAWRGDYTFNDSSWSSGLLGAGFDLESTFDPYIGTDLESAMDGQNASAYLRIPFAYDADWAAPALRLRVRYDDGFVAYLNGTKVAERNAPASPVWNSTATGEHADGQAVVYEDIDLTAYLGLLKDSTSQTYWYPNILAIQAMNFAAGDNDFLISAEVDYPYRPVLVDVNRSVIDSAWLSYGTGNVDADPQFANDTYQLPSAWHAYAVTSLGSWSALPPDSYRVLASGSPAIGTGPNGVDMGAGVGSGASISGAPVGTTSSTSATLTLGGPMYSFKYRLDGGAWSAEQKVVQSVSSITASGATATATVTGHGFSNGEQIVIDGAQYPFGGTFTISGVTANTFQYTMAASPGGSASGSSICRRAVLPQVALSGLGNGPHTFEAIAKDSAYVWQAEAQASSRTWTVDTAAPRVTAVAMNDYTGHTAKTVSGSEPSGIGVRKLTVTFGEAVTFDASDVLVEKVTFSGESETIGDTLVPLSLSGSGTDVMTIEFTSASVLDTWVKVTLKGNATLKDLAGNLLDGEAQRGAGGAGFIRDAALDLPTGDGFQGGSAIFYVASLRGDYQDDALTPGPPDGQITLSDVDGFAAAFQANSLDADYQDDALTPGPPDGFVSLSDVDGFAAAFQAGLTLTALPEHLTYGAAAGAPEPLGLGADALALASAAQAAGESWLPAAGGVLVLDGAAPVAMADTFSRRLDGDAGLLAGDLALASAPAAAADPMLEPDGGLPDWQAGVDLLALPALAAPLAV